MLQDSLARRQEVFLSSATIAAHSTAVETGFRARDVKFFCELFSNWADAALSEDMLRIQNTQVGRYLTGLVTEGHTRRKQASRPVRFQLTRTGLVDLLRRLTDRRSSESPAHFFFVYFFLKNYRNRIHRLVHQEGSQFPPTLQHKVEALLDTNALADRERDAATRRLRKLDERIASAKNSSALVTASRDMGLPFEQIAKELERKYPYNLNSQKPLSQLLGEIPEEQRLWEVQFGNLRRCDQLWVPVRAMLNQYVQVLEALRNSGAKGIDTPLP